MPRKVTPILEAALDDYLQSRHHLSANTLMNDRSVLHRFIRGLGEQRQIGNITPQQVERWFAVECVAANPKPSSYNKVRQRVGGFLQYCARHGWVKTDVMRDVGKKSVPQIERQRLDPDQMLQLLDAVVDPRERGLLACAMHTGLRASEITTIKLRDVDLDRGEIYFFRAKTASDDRLPITAGLDRELRRWMTHYANELGDAPMAPKMLLFPARRPPRLRGGNVPGEPRIMRLGDLQPFKAIAHPQRIVQKAMRAIGFDVTFQEGLHTLRRSAARALFDHITEHAGEPGYDSALRTTASFLGHKSTTTTELYLGLSGDRRKRDAILRASDFLKPAAVERPRLRSVE
jgi:integrase